MFKNSQRQFLGLHVIFNNESDSLWPCHVGLPSYYFVKEVGPDVFFCCRCKNEPTVAGSTMFFLSLKVYKQDQ